MKRIYLLFCMLLGLFGLTNASAQVSDYMADDDWPLILSIDQFSSPNMDTGEGNWESLLNILQFHSKEGDAWIAPHPGNDFWHSNWHNGNQTPDTHYIQVEMLTMEEWNDAALETELPDYAGTLDEMTEYPTKILFVFTRRGADNDHTIKWIVRGTNDPDAEKDACEVLATIDTPLGSNTETLTSDAFDHKGYRYLRFYSAEQKGSSYGSRGYFHLSRFQLFPAVEKAEADAATEMLTQAYDKYSEELAKYELCLGDTPGRYNEDLFYELSAAVDGLLDEGVALTKEAAQALIDDVEAKFQALKDSRNMEYSIESGYYFVKAAMSYNDGLDKYLMGGINSNNVLRGEWSDYEYYEDAGKPEEGKARMLWKVDAKGDGTYDFVNMFKNARFRTVAATNSEVPMYRGESDTLMVIEPVFTDEDNVTWVNIRMNKATNSDGTPVEDFGIRHLHQGGHNNGGGARNVIMGWYGTFNSTQATAGASEWIFEPVDDAEAQQIIDDWSELNDMDSKIREIRQMIREGKDSLEVAIDTKTVGIITEGSQFSSPFSQNDLGGSDGGNIVDGVLIDGNGSTYWHSVWNNSSGKETPDDAHYFQVELAEPLTQDVYIKFKRRDTNNNQITDWIICGTNDGDPSIVQADCEELFTWNTPWNSGNQTESFKSEPFDTKGYKFIRFYNGGNNAGSAFFHLSEIQLCYDVENTTSQYVALGATATKLEEMIEQLDPMEDEEYTIDDYNAMKAAYDAFMAKFVDPNPLRNAIAANENATTEVVVGTDPGFWPANSSASQLDATVESAKAYDAAGAYTDAQSQKFIADMTTFKANIPEEANKVQEGKWYRIRYGKEAEYDQYKWSKDGNGVDNRIVDEEVIGMYNEELYGKYVTVAHDEDEVIDTDENGADVMGHRVLPMSKEDVTLETYVYGDALEDIEDKDMALWRFINVGDSAYIIQNKATGLFMRQDGNMRVSVQPTLFNQLIAGYGQNAFIAKQFESGATWSPLHFARNYNILTLWGSLGSDGVWAGMGGKDGRRACFFVEEVEDVASDFAFGDFKISFTPGDIYGRCYPVPVTVKDANQGTVWTVNSMERTAGDEETPELVKLDLAKITEPTIPAGRPFLYIVDGDMPEAGEEYEPAICDFSFTLDLVNVPKTDSFLKGAFDSKTINQKWIGVGSGHDEEALQFKSSGSSTGVNRTYILDTDPAAEPFAFNAELEFNFDESLEDGIKEAIKTVSRIGNIYTLDGRLVGRGNINSITQKGVYIVNGIKVTIK